MQDLFRWLLAHKIGSGQGSFAILREGGSQMLLAPIALQACDRCIPLFLSRGVLAAGRGGGGGPRDYAAEGICFASAMIQSRNDFSSGRSASACGETRW